MKQRLKTTLIITALIAASGCRSVQNASGTQPALASRAAYTPLDEYRRILIAFQDMQRENENLRARHSAAREEIDQLYQRLAQEQKLRREAQIELESTVAQIEAAAGARQTIDNLRTALGATKTELAVVKAELKMRREELMKIVLEQQQWNKYGLDKLKLQ